MGGFLVNLTAKLRREQRASKRDGGWAWVIVFASFVMQLIIDGTLSGFGTFFLAMQKDEVFIRKNYTRTELSVPGSIQTGAFLCSGAIASPFIQRFGFRITGCFGSLMASSGIALSSLQTNLHLFNIFYGFLTGSGFGILMVCAIVSVNYYFERLRGTASGIAMSGAGVGYLCIPLLLSSFVNQFGWRYTLLAYSAFMFVLLASAVLVIRPFVVVTTDGSEEDDRDGSNETLDQAAQQESNEGKQNGYLSTQSAEPTSAKQYSTEECSDERPVGKGDGTQPSPCEASLSTSFAQKNSGARLSISGAAKDNSFIIPAGCRTTESINAESEFCKTNEIPSQSPSQPAGQYPLHLSGETIPGPPIPPGIPADDDLGSTVGSRLWKSTLAFKRNNLPHRTQRTYSSSRLRNSTSRNVYIQQHMKCKSAGKRSFILDPFEQVDVFFSASLSSLGCYDGHPVRHPSGQKSILFNSQLHDAHHFESVQSSAIHSVLHIEHNEPQPYHHKVGFTDSTERSSETFGEQERRTPSDWMSKIDEVDWYKQGKGNADSGGALERDTILTGAYGLTKVLRFRNWIVTVFDLKLFTSPSFLLITVIGVTNQLAYFIPFVYLADFAMSKGLKQSEANILLVILGAMHTVGRILAGCAANMGWVDTVYLSGLGSLSAAVVTLLLPNAFPYGFAAYSLYAASFGLALAFPVPMVHIILVRFLGLQRLTASYSNLNMIKGIASVVGPLIAVSIVERTGQTDHYFYVAGMCFLLSALAHIGLCRLCCGAIRPEEVNPRSNCCSFPPNPKQQLDNGEFDDVSHASGTLASNNFSPHRM